MFLKMFINMFINSYNIVVNSEDIYSRNMQKQKKNKTNNILLTRLTTESRPDETSSSDTGFP